MKSGHRRVIILELTSFESFHDYTLHECTRHDIVCLCVFKLAYPDIVVIIEYGLNKPETIVVHKQTCTTST